MNPEYRLAKGWRLFVYLFMPVLAAVFIYLAITPFLEKPSAPSHYFIFPALALLFIALTAWAFIELYKERIIIGNDRIIQISAFKTKELPFNLVKGYTEDQQQYLRILPFQEGFPVIKISPYTGRLHELKEELAQRFTDLDAETLLAEEQELLQNETLGNTEEERRLQLEETRKTTRIVNTTAWVLSLWLLFYPRPYQLLVYSIITLFAFVLLVLYRHQGLIRIDEKPRSAYPSLASALTLPSIVLMLRSLLDYDIFDYHRLWSWVGAGTVALFVFLIYTTKAYANKKQFIASLFFLIFAAAFSFGTIVQVNCLQDTSLPRQFTAQVLEKRISKGKTTTYYLQLDAWGPQTQTGEISVPKSFYDRISINQKVQVHLKQGTLHIPWLFVTE